MKQLLEKLQQLQVGIDAIRGGYGTNVAQLKIGKVAETILSFDIPKSELGDFTAARFEGEEPDAFVERIKKDLVELNKQQAAIGAFVSRLSFYRVNYEETKDLFSRENAGEVLAKTKKLLKEVEEIQSELNKKIEKLEKDFKAALVSIEKDLVTIKKGSVRVILWDYAEVKNERVPESGKNKFITGFVPEKQHISIQIRLLDGKEEYISFAVDREEKARQKKSATQPLESNRLSIKVAKKMGVAPENTPSDTPNPSKFYTIDEDIRACFFGKQRKYLACKIIDIEPQYADRLNLLAMYNAAKKFKTNAPMYQFYSNNCATPVSDILQAGGAHNYKAVPMTMLSIADVRTPSSVYKYAASLANELPRDVVVHVKEGDFKALAGQVEQMALGFATLKSLQILTENGKQEISDTESQQKTDNPRGLKEYFGTIQAQLEGYSKQLESAKPDDAEVILQALDKQIALWSGELGKNTGEFKKVSQNAIVMLNSLQSVVRGETAMDRLLSGSKWTMYTKLLDAAVIQKNGYEKTTVSKTVCEKFVDDIVGVEHKQKNADTLLALRKWFSPPDKKTNTTKEDFDQRANADEFIEGLTTQEYNKSVVGKYFEILVMIKNRIDLVFAPLKITDEKLLSLEREGRIKQTMVALLQIRKKELDTQQHALKMIKHQLNQKSPKQDLIDIFQNEMDICQNVIDICDYQVKELRAPLGTLNVATYFSASREEGNLLSSLANILPHQESRVFHDLDGFMTSVVNGFGKPALDTIKTPLYKFWQWGQRHREFEQQAKGEIGAVLINPELDPCQKVTAIKKLVADYKPSSFKFWRRSDRARYSELERNARVLCVVEAFKTGHIDEMGFYLSMEQIAKELPNNSSQHLAIGAFVNALKTAYVKKEQVILENSKMLTSVASLIKRAEKQTSSYAKVLSQYAVGDPGATAKVYPISSIEEFSEAVDAGREQVKKLVAEKDVTEQNKEMLGLVERMFTIERKRR